MKQALCSIQVLALLLTPTMLGAQTLADDKLEPSPLALQLHNPVATLVSVPIESDWDIGSGPAHAMTYTIEAKPVVPFSLNQDWNLITRTLVPFIYAESPEVGGASKAGLGDITATIYFSPDKPLGGWYWGAGPGLIFPSATHNELGAEQWSAGPTAAVLRQNGGWTVGALTGHAWSIAANHNRDDVSTTFLQPFISYTTKKDTTFGLDTASQYDWTGRQWTVPMEASVGQVLHFGGHDIEVGLTGRYYAERGSDGPRWGLGIAVTFLFPKLPKAR
jgi:hypothetical protein